MLRRTGHQCIVKDAQIFDADAANGYILATHNHVGQKHIRIPISTILMPMSWFYRFYSPGLVIEARSHAHVHSDRTLDNLDEMDSEFNAKLQQIFVQSLWQPGLIEFS